MRLTRFRRPTATLLPLVFPLIACDCNKCDIKRLADLLIPRFTQIRNPYTNQVVLNPYTNQPIVDANILYHNRRTGEFFSPGVPSQQGVTIGDVIEVGIQILNQYTNGQCNEVADASASSTGFTTRGQGPSGTFNFPMTEAYTPAIGGNGSGWAVSSFTFNQPGYYFFDTAADNKQQVAEQSEANNGFSNSDNGNNLGRGVPSMIIGGIEVTAAKPGKETKLYYDENCVAVLDIGNTLESRKQSKILAFVQSPAYVAFYLNAIQKNPKHDLASQRFGLNE